MSGCRIAGDGPGCLSQGGREGYRRVTGHGERTNDHPPAGGCCTFVRLWVYVRASPPLTRQLEQSIMIEIEAWLRISRMNDQRHGGRAALPSRWLSVARISTLSLANA